MIPYLGDYDEDATVYVPFNTFTSDDPSESATITNLAAADIKVHKDGSVTQIVTDGATVAIDFDGITGNHLITIDTSVHADYSTGSDYLVRIEGTTVDAGTINAFVAQFSIENRHSATAVAAVKAETALIVADTNELQTNQGNWLTATGFATPTNITAGTITTATNVTTVNGLAAGVITATAIATDAVDADALAADALAEIKTQVATALTDIDLDHLITTDLPTNWATDVNPGSVVGELGGATFSTSTDSQEALAAASAPSAATISAAVWDLDATAHQTTGTFGQAIGDPVANTKTLYQALITDATGVSVTADVFSVKAQTDNIVDDTNELQLNQGNWLTATGFATSAALTTAQNDLDIITGSDGATLATAQALYAPAKAGDSMALTAGGVDAIWDEDIVAAHTTADTAGKKLADAGGAGDPWSTALPGAYGAGTAGEILGDWKNGERLDLLLDAIPTTPMRGTDNAATATALATAQTDLDTITDTDGVVLGAAGVDLIWDEVLTGATHNVTSSAGKRLRTIDAAFEVHSGTAQAGTATTITMDTGADGTTNEIYAGDRIVITAGTGAGEHGLILSYVASTRVATMSKAWVVTPDNTSEFTVVPADCDVELWNDNSVTGDGDWALMQTDLDTLTAGVTLADVAHGGSAATITLDHVKVISSTEPGIEVITTGLGDNAVDLRANNATGVGLLAYGETSGMVIANTGAGSGSALAINANGSGTGLDVFSATGTVLSTAVTDEITASVLTTQMTESYAANGVAPTLAEAQFAIHQMLQQFGISGTALTVRKLDDTTTAFIVTLDSATAPTDAKRV